MAKLKLLILSIIALSNSISIVAQQTDRAYQYADELIARLSLDEKISLMMNWPAPIERLDIPSYNWWNEALHGIARAGYATVFPQAIGMAATFKPQLIQTVFSVISDEGRAKYNAAIKEKGHPDQYEGLTFWTPNINIFRDPRWGRGQETYGEDPWLTTQMGLAAVKGIQGEITADGYRKATACAKHFAVHSGPEWSRHSFEVSDLDPQDLRETYLPAFEALVKAGVGQVMCAYNRVEGQPCCSNKRLLNQILREEWQYDGILVSDCFAINDFFEPGHHETYKDAPSSAGAALLSGTDLECGSVYWNLSEAVAQNIISVEQINQSLRRILAERYRLGEINRAKTPWDDIKTDTINCAKHKALALETARRSIVLLKNSGILPLKQTSRIAVMGPNALDTIMPLGNYSGKAFHTVSVLEGLTQRFGDVEYLKGCDYVGDTYDKTIPDAKIVIFVGGISPTLEGEEMDVPFAGFRGGDRLSIELPEVQRKLIKHLVDNGKQVVLVNCSGSAVGLSPENEICAAIVQLWYPGESGGTALAEMLAGDFEPTGRLPVTFYASDSQLPDYESYDMAGRTYRYLREKPLYPFGYGLGYATLKYGSPKLMQPDIHIGDTIQMTVPVKNLSDYRKGEAIVQVYMRFIDDNDDGPNKSLCALASAEVNPGESSEITLTIDSNTLRSYNPDTDRMEVIPGQYILYAGTSSETLESVNLRILP